MITAMLVEIHPKPTDVIVAFLPAGSTVRVHRPTGTADYTQDGQPLILVTPGDRATFRWRADFGLYPDLRSVWDSPEYLGPPTGRQTYRDTALSLAGYGVAIIRHKRFPRRGRLVWLPVGFTVTYRPERRPA